LGEILISDEIGNKYGKLLILGETAPIKSFRQYVCICDCGGYHVASRNNILQGMSIQCRICSGEQRRNSQTSINVKENRLTYDSWNGMFSRCGKEPNYMNVTICDEWKVRPHGFFKFKEDLGERPSRDYTLDRIDYKGNYTKENCRWAKRSVQNHNKSKKSDSITSDYIGVSLQKEKWVVQIMREGVKHRSIHLLELDAATYYDNISEEWYGDRPNKTECRAIIPYKPGRGGVSFDKKTGKYRARLSLPDGTRKNVGFFVTEQEAKEKLKSCLEEFYS